MPGRDRPTSRPRAGGLVEGSALDRLAPRFDVAKRHSLRIEAPPAAVWNAVLAHEFASSGVGRWLLALRGYGRRTAASGRGTLPERLERFGFVELERIEGRELVFGIAGRFWLPRGDLRRLTREVFLAFQERGCARGFWNIEVRDAGGGASELATETRVICHGDAARRRFRAYWTVIAPFSGLTRRGMLRAIAREARRAAPRPP